MKKNIFGKLTVLILVVALAVTFVGCGNSGSETEDDPINTQEDNNSEQSSGDTEDEKSVLDTIKENKVIVMGTNAEFPPFEYRNDAGEVEGFDVAIAQTIADKLGVELKVEDMAFGSLGGALKTQKIDLIAAGMSVTPERKENVDFSDGYYTASQKIIVKKDNTEIKGKADLEGKKIGVQEGTTGDTEASEINDVDMNRFKKGIDAIMDLKNGRIDAVVIDASPAEVFVNKNDDLMILDEELTDEEYAIAVDKGNEELLEVINEAISELKGSGKYDELVSQYIGQ